MTKQNPDKPVEKPPNEQEPLTKDEFLKVLKKVIRRVPKPLHEKEKKETSG